VSQRFAGGLVLVLLAVLGGCRAGGADNSAAGDIPDSQAFVAYAPPGAGFTVDVPEGWARTEGGGAVTFTDRFNSARLETVAAVSAPTVPSAEQEMKALGVTAPRLRPGTVTVVTPPGGPAVLLTYETDAPPDPVTGKVARLAVDRYEFWKDGREVILTLSGAVGSDNVDPWRTVVDSFRWS
jgi:hypothetical protein